MSDTIKTVLVEGGTPVALSDSDEKTRFIYNLLPVGHFYDKRYGEVWINSDKINQIVQNFGKYPAYEVPIKIGHDDGAKSPGKVIGVQAKDEGLEITMIVDKETSEAITKEQYRYMSAEFDENYQDKESGKSVGAVLLGAALVNQPANPYMEPLKFVDDINPKGGNNDMSEIEELRKQLSDAQAELKTVRDEAEANAKKFADIEATNKELIAERERAEAAKNEAEVKAFCDKWSGQGIPPAVIEKVKPVLLGQNSRVIKLSDSEKDNVPSLKFFDDLFTGLPKMPMTQISGTDTPVIELSDVEKAKARAKEIAESLRK